MTQALALYMVLVAVGLILMMAWQYVRRTHELLSIRNFAILGFILFQILSALQPLWTQLNNRYSLQDWNAAGLKFVVSVTVFLLVALPSYRWGFGAKQLAHLAPTVKTAPPEALMYLLAITLTGVAIFGRVGVFIPNATISALMGKVALAFAAMACGMAGWVWAPRLFNPIVAAFSSSIILVNLALVLSETFGRRSLVAVGAAMLWGMYYSHWRKLTFWQLGPRLALMAIPPIILLAAFTSVRESQQREALSQRVKQLASASDLKMGVLDLISGQNCAPTSMWLIENYPERFDHRHLMTVKYFFMLPIPRFIWHEKPEPLSTEIAAKARIEGVREDELKIGPGIIGHAAAEGGWYALIIYAVLAGLFLRFFDEIVARDPSNAYVVLPIGSALGQTVGLARGDTSVFAANYVAGVLGAYVATLMIGKFFGMLGWGMGRADSIVSASEYEAADQDGAEPATGYGEAPAGSRA